MNKLRNYVSGKYLLIFFVVLLSVGLIYFLGSYFLETNPKIKDLKLTNISDTSVTVTYFTDTPSVTSVIVSDSDNFNILSGVLKVKYYDDRNDGILRTSHHVTINGLKAESVYFLRVMGNLKEVSYTYPTIVTGRTLDTLRTPDPSYGKFLQQTGGSLLNDYILFATLNDSSVQSTFLNIDVAFTFDKTNFRTSDLSSNLTYKNGDQIELQLVDLSQTRSFKAKVGEDQPINVSDDIKISADIDKNNNLNSNILTTVLGREALDFSCGGYPAGANYCNSGNGISYTCIDPTGWKDTGTCSKATPPKEANAYVGSELDQQRREQRENKPLVAACAGRSAGAWCGGNDVYDCDGSGGGRVAESCGDRGCKGMPEGTPDRCNDKVAEQGSGPNSKPLYSPQNQGGTITCSGKTFDMTISNSVECKFDNKTFRMCASRYTFENDNGCVLKEDVTNLCLVGVTELSDSVGNSHTCVTTSGEYKHQCDSDAVLDGSKCVKKLTSGSGTKNYTENRSLPPCDTLSTSSSPSNATQCTKLGDEGGINYKCNDGYELNNGNCVLKQTLGNCIGGKSKLSEEISNTFKCQEGNTSFTYYQCNSGYDYDGNGTCKPSQSIGVVLSSGVQTCPANLNCSFNGGQGFDGSFSCRESNDAAGNILNHCCPSGQKIGTDSNGSKKCVSASLNKNPVLPTLAQSVLGTETTSGTSVNVNETGVYNVTSVSGYEVTTKEVRVVSIKDGVAQIKFFNDANSNGSKDDGEEYITTPLEVKLDKQRDLSTYTLTTGWNLISWSITDSNIKTGMDLLNKIAKEGGYATHIATYRNGGWVLLSQRAGQKFGKDFDLIPNEGYFVKVLKTVDLNIEGTKIARDQDIFFSTGWNLIGYRSEIKSAKSFIDEVNKTSTLDMDTVTRFENSRYENLVKDSGTFYGNDFNIIEDKGYFVRLKKAGVVWKR